MFTEIPCLMQHQVSSCTCGPAASSDPYHAGLHLAAAYHGASHVNTRLSPSLRSLVQLYASESACFISSSYGVCAVLHCVTFGAVLYIFLLPSKLISVLPYTSVLLPPSMLSCNTHTGFWWRLNSDLYPLKVRLPTSLFFFFFLAFSCSWVTSSFCVEYIVSWVRVTAHLPS